MGSSATIKLVKTELEHTIQQVQKNFSAFAADVSEIALLQECLDQVNQIRGTFVMLEDKGASLLCEELTKLFNELSLDDLAEQSVKGRRVSDAVFQSMMFLSRYLEYLELKGSGCEELLIPEINMARRARGISQLPDHYFYPVKLGKLVKPKSVLPFAYTSETVGLIKRYRHMYQAAMLKMLQGYRPEVALTYMSRSLNQLDKLAANTPIAPLFWISATVADVMVQQKADLTANRKVMFAKLDKQIRLLQVKGKAGFNEQPPFDLIKELLYFLAITSEFSKQSKKIVQVYKLPDPGISESELIEQRRLLSSPGTSVMQSVSTALNDEMNSIKDMLDNAAVGGEGADFSADALQSALMRLADILSMVSLNSPANVLKKQATAVENWVNKNTPDMVKLMAIADSVLYAESAVQRLLYDGGLSDSEDYVAAAADAQVSASRMVLIDQAQNCISIAKRSISAFIESHAEQQHLSSVNEQLDLVRGALIFLDSQDGVTIISQCMQYVENRLVKADQEPDPGSLESLADALSSMEFYLEGLLNESQQNRQLLALAKEAASHLA